MGVSVFEEDLRELESIANRLRGISFLYLVDEPDAETKLALDACIERLDKITDGMNDAVDEGRAFLH